MENKIENLIEAGILDPAKVTRHGLLNACGIAGILLTTQVISAPLFLQLQALTLAKKAMHAVSTSVPANIIKHPLQMLDESSTLNETQYQQA